LQADRKSTQRGRLLNGMIDVAVREGYAGASIARVIATAGVSRPTFYDYFTDKDDCFLAALAEIQQRLRTDVARAVDAASAEQAVRATIQTLTAFATSEPELAHFLTNGPMAGGPRLLDARDEGIGEVAEIIEQAQAKLPPQAAMPDVSARVLLGTVYRLLARRLRQGERGTAGGSDALLQWIKSYERPIGEHRWRTLRPAGSIEPWTLLPETVLREPAALLRGRRRNPKEIAENQRQRILFATATVAQEKGYAASTIADITERAGVDRRAFNALFSDKQEAFMALIALGFQRTMAVTARAFFTGAGWPDRIWEAGRAFTEFFQRNPLLTHIGFVEPYAVGSGAAQGVEDSFAAFTVFLQEGLRDAPLAAAVAEPPVLEAIATSIFETGYYESRYEASREMSRLLPHVVFLLLAPFMGAAEANRFIEGKLDSKSETGVRDLSA
jgi:AcrR family transcriptional regulator